MKKCRICGLQKSNDEFYKRKETKDGLRSECKACVRGRVKEYSKQNPNVSKNAMIRFKQKIKEGEKWRVKKCRLCKIEKPAKDFYDNENHPGKISNECKECLRQQYKENKKADPDFNHKRYMANKDAVIKRSRRYRKENRDKVLDSLKDWRKRNPHKAREYALKRRKRKDKAGGTATSEQINMIGEMQGWRCATCGRDVKSSYHIDHITPVALNGSSDRHNLQILCKHCNLRKHCKDPIDWAIENGKLL